MRKNRYEGKRTKQYFGEESCQTQLSWVKLIGHIKLKNKKLKVKKIQKSQMAKKKGINSNQKKEDTFNLIYS